MSVFDEALRYAAAGIAVLPILPDGSKSPPVKWSQLEERTATDAELREWFSRGRREPGIAAACGRGSGRLELLDHDDEMVGEEWVELMHDHHADLIARLTLVRTPRPGLHAWYRVEDGFDMPGPEKLAWRPATAEELAQKPSERRKTLIETKGQGGYGLLPGGSLQAHKLGRPYVHIAGPGFDALAVISRAERDLMLCLARLLDRTPASEITAARTPRPDDGDDSRPGEDYERRGSWPELLERHGWRQVGQRPGYSLWCRPDKDGSGHSATLGYCKGAHGEPLLRVFSSSAEPFGLKAVGLFNALALLQFQGDHAAAAGWLRTQGYGGERPAGRRTTNGRTAERPGTVEEIPLPPAWPVLSRYALHGIVGELVRLIEPQTEADSAGVLLQLLAAAGNAIGRGAYFVVEEDHHFCNLFVATVGATASARKGTAWGRVRAIMRIACPDWAHRHVYRGLHSAEGLIYHLRDRKEKAKADGSREILDDGAEIKNVLVVETELGSVLRRMSREGNTLSAVLRQSWDGETLGSLTKHSPDRASDALVSIAGHITEAELADLIGKVELVNGFGNRVLWGAVRRSKILPHGGRPLNLTEPASRLGRAILGAGMAGRVSWEPDAARVWESVYKELTGDRWGGLRGAVTRRAEAQTLRLAMLYCLLDNRDLIALDHLRAALALWRYCEASALRLFGDYEPEDTLPAEILSHLRQAGAEGLTRKAINDLYGGHLKGAEIVHALSSLRDRRLAWVETQKTPGRSREIWRCCGLSGLSGESDRATTYVCGESADKVRIKGADNQTEQGERLSAEMAADADDPLSPHLIRSLSADLTPDGDAFSALSAYSATPDPIPEGEDEDADDLPPDPDALDNPFEV